MNDTLLLLGLIAAPIGLAGLIRPVAVLHKSRWVGAGILGLGSMLVISGMCRSDDGSEPGADHMLLDEYIPEYDVHEIHAIRVHAPPERVYAAIQAVTAPDLGAANALIFLRSLPAYLSGRNLRAPRRSRPILKPRPDSGFCVLAEEPNLEVVFGFVGPFWELEGGRFYRIARPAEFLELNHPDYAKAAWNFYLQARPDGTCRLTTETRVICGSPEAKQRFKRYWSLIYPGSAYIRRAFLKAVKRRAEAN